MSFNESNTVEQMSARWCRFADSGLRWSNLMAVAKF